jgi:hypothetical protein
MSSNWRARYSRPMKRRRAVKARCWPPGRVVLTQETGLARKVVPSVLPLAVNPETQRHGKRSAALRSWSKKMETKESVA